MADNRMESNGRSAPGSNGSAGCLSPGGGLPVLPIVSPPLIFNDGGKTGEELKAEGK